MRHARARAAALQAHIYLIQGDLERASQWAVTYQPGRQAAPGVARLEVTTFARVLISQGSVDEALTFVEGQGHLAELAGHRRRALELQILGALVYQAQGATPGAMAALEQALALAEPEGYARLFLDERLPMQRLLSAFTRQRAASERLRRFAGNLLLGFTAQAGAFGRARATGVASMVEALSDRELDLLRLAAEGATNRAIAHALVISIHTAKKHVANILLKLGVANRAEAIARARKLGLIEPRVAPE